MAFENNILFTHSMVVADSRRPKSQHSPKRNEDREEVGDQKHGLCFDLEVPLDVPKSKGGGNRAAGLCDSEVCDLQKGE